MLGLLNNSWIAFISSRFGHGILSEVLSDTGLHDHVQDGSHAFVASCPYADSITDKFIAILSAKVKMSPDELGEQFGQFFISYMSLNGYDKLMRSCGGDFVAFCKSLNNLHLHVSLGMPAMVSPEFAVSHVTNTSLLFHHHSKRQGYSSWVVGILKAVGHQIFGIEVDVKLTSSRKDGTCDHEIFTVTYNEGEGNNSSSLTKGLPVVPEGNLIGINPESFNDLFPYHIIIGLDLSILQVGRVLARLAPSLLSPGAKIDTLLEIKHPWTWDLSHLLRGEDNTIVLVTEGGLELKGGVSKIRQVVRSSEGSPLSEKTQEALLFMGSPRPHCLDKLTSQNLYLSDFPSWDMGADYVLLSEKLKVEAELKARAEEMNQELASEANEAYEANILLKESLAKALASNTGAVLKRVDLDTMTPAALAIKLLDSLMIGEEVDAQEVLAVREALLNSGTGTGLWKPLDIAYGAIGGALGGDVEVNAALEMMLIGDSSKGRVTSNYEDFMAAFGSARSFTRTDTLEGLLQASGSHARFQQEAADDALNDLEEEVRTLSRSNSRTCSPKAGLSSPFSAPSFPGHLSGGGPAAIIRRAPVVPVDVEATEKIRGQISSGRSAQEDNLLTTSVGSVGSSRSIARGKTSKRRNSIISIISGAFTSKQPESSSRGAEERNPEDTLKKKGGQERRKSSFVDQVKSLIGGKASQGPISAEVETPSLSRNLDEPSLRLPPSPVAPPHRLPCTACQGSGFAPTIQVSLMTSHSNMSQLASASRSLEPPALMEPDIIFPDVGKISLYASLTKSRSGRLTPPSPAAPYGSGSPPKAHAAPMSQMVRVRSDASSALLANVLGQQQQPLMGLNRADSFAIGLYNIPVAIAKGMRSNSSEVKETKACPAAEQVIALLAQPSDKFMRAVSTIDDWFYDSFALASVTDGRPLSSLAFFL